MVRVTEGSSFKTGFESILSITESQIPVVQIERERERENDRRKGTKDERRNEEGKKNRAKREMKSKKKVEENR